MLCRQENASEEGNCACEQDPNGPGGMSYNIINSATPLSKFFSGSVDLNHPDLSLNSNLFNSRPVNGNSAMLPGPFSNELHAPGLRDSQTAPSMPLPGFSNIFHAAMPAAPVSNLSNVQNGAEAQVENNHAGVPAAATADGMGQQGAVTPASMHQPLKNGNEVTVMKMG